MEREIWDEPARPAHTGGEQAALVLRLRGAKAIVSVPTLAFSGGTPETYVREQLCGIKAIISETAKFAKIAHHMHRYEPGQDT